MPDAPLDALTFLRALVATKLRKRVGDVPASATLKTLTGGKSALQNVRILSLYRSIVLRTTSTILC